MSYCINPQCLKPLNPDKEKFCFYCGSNLLLNERYQAIKPLGQGGFGKTFLAADRHIPSRPRCVIKQLSFSTQDPTTYQKVVSLFRQEAVRLDQLGKHEQIPQLLAYFEQDKQLYLVQELILGQTLSQELAQIKVYQEAQIWELLRDMLPILQFVHANNVIHRDIKPANIIRRSPDSRLILIDFGVAKLFTSNNPSKTGTIVGSPEYMPPEQTRGKVFPSSDLYSLGVTCIQLLTNSSPLDMFDVVEEQWLWQNHLPQGIEVSTRLVQILNKLLQPSLKERYQSAEEALQAVNYLPLSSNIKRSAADDLVSEVGINYTKLRQLLAYRKWKEADEETWFLMRQALGKPSSGYLFCSDINKFPIQDLWTIDQLWLKYSHQHFSFSIQKQIYESVEREYNLFCDRVGWPTYQPFIPDSLMQYNIKAPLGHLPSRKGIGGSEWWRHIDALAAKISQF